jgi:hypothetical protein
MSGRIKCPEPGVWRGCRLEEARVDADTAGNGEMTAGASSLPAGHGTQSNGSAPGHYLPPQVSAPGTPPRATAQVAAADRPTGDRPTLSDSFGASPTLRYSAEMLREAVVTLTLPFEVANAVENRRLLADLLAQLDDYLLPRLRRIDAPLLAVVGGSTGAGKSTLVNSLVRREVTRSGVLRPTTRSPVLIHHPFDSGAFLTQRILPGFARVTSEAPEPLQPIAVDAPRVTALRLVPDEALAPGLAIIDAPDIDSLVETNRDLAIQLLAAADLWLFVTTAARYSDAVPWDMLRTAVERGVSVAVVLDRVPNEAMSEVRHHLATLLRDRGLSTAPLFTIPETARDLDGFLPEDVVAPLLGWLGRLARDARSRDVVVRRTLVGVLDSLHDRVDVIAGAADEQVRLEQELRQDLQQVYDATGRELAAKVSDGTLVRGEVLARWSDYVGTGDVFRGLEGTVGRLRHRFTAAVSGRPAPSDGVGSALVNGVRAMIMAGLQSSAERAEQRWRARRSGAALLRAIQYIPGLPAGLQERVARSVREWRDAVADLIRAESQGRRTTPRSASFGVDGAAVILMLLSVTNDDSAGAGAVAARVLAALFGQDVVQSLVEAARADLVRRVGELVESERSRFGDLLDSVGVRTDLPAALRTHLRHIEGAR